MITGPQCQEATVPRSVPIGQKAKSWSTPTTTSPSSQDFAIDADLGGNGGGEQLNMNEATKEKSNKIKAECHRSRRTVKV